jgi:cyclopropane-fatty-acyl-phospholipid synthase
LDDQRERAVRLAGQERVRVWRLYLRAARNGFETGFTAIYQVLARRAA